MEASFFIEPFAAGYRYSDTEIAVNVKFRGNEYNAETGLTAVGFLFMGIKITRQLKDNSIISETKTASFTTSFNSKTTSGYINYLTNITGVVNDNALIIFGFDKKTVDNFFDASLYNYTQIELLGGFTGSTGNSLAWIPREGGKQYLTQPDAAIFCPANGYSQSGNIFSNSNSFRKLTEDMVLEEFRRIAADRLECKPEQVRVKTKIINDWSETGVRKTINLTEIQDNDRTTAYIQRMNAIVNIADPDFPSVIITDNFKNQGNEIYVSAAGDTAPAATGYFADSIDLNGDLTIQLIIYIAERLV